MPAARPLRYGIRNRKAKKEARLSAKNLVMRSDIGRQTMTGSTNTAKLDEVSSHYRAFDLLSAQRHFRFCAGNNRSA